MARARLFVLLAAVNCVMFSSAQNAEVPTTAMRTSEREAEVTVFAPTAPSASGKTVEITHVVVNGHLAQKKETTMAEDHVEVINVPESSSSSSSKTVKIIARVNATGAHGDAEGMTETHYDMPTETANEDKLVIPVHGERTLAIPSDEDKRERETGRVEARERETGQVEEKERETGQVEEKERETGQVEEKERETGQVEEKERETGQVEEKEKETGQVEEKEKIKLDDEQSEIAGRERKDEL